MAGPPRPLRITYLVEEAIHPWGGVQTVFREADALAAHGHDVTILCRTGPPAWHPPACRVVTVRGFSSGNIPESDLVVGTFCPTVPAAWRAGCGRPVHYCQGYEGDNPRHADKLHLIERIYRLPGVAHIAIAPFLARRLRARFGIEPRVVPYGIRAELFRPAAAPATTTGRRLRLGLVGPWDVGWKDLPTGVAGARLARTAGLDVELVRISPCALSDEERDAWGDLPVEWHENLPLARMPDVYRSLDLFLGTSSGGAEGFFLPAVEAMACGIPCVLSDIACFRDYEERHDYARFFVARDATDLARAIRELAAQPTARATLREAGLRTAARHTFERHVDGMEEAFQSLVPPGEAMVEGGQPGREVREAMREAWLCHDLLELAAGVAVSRGIELARAATALFPTDADAWQLQGRLEAATGDLPRAILSLAMASRCDPLSPSARELLGRCELARGDFAAALAAFRLAETLGMTGPAILVAQAQALLALGRGREATEVLARTRPVAVDPGPKDIARAIPEDACTTASRR